MRVGNGVMRRASLDNHVAREKADSIRAFKLWGIAALALFFAGTARADTFDEAHDSFSAVFSFVRLGPDGQQMLAGSVSTPLPISLPPALAEWRCERRPQIARGTLVHQSIVCERQGFEVGIGVTCPLDDVGSDDQTFWLHAAKNEGSVIFNGHCVTMRNRSIDDGF